MQRKSYIIHQNWYFTFCHIINVLVLPYFPYSRHDKIDLIGSPLAAKIVCSILESAGVNLVFTLEIHSPEIVAFSNIPIVNLKMTDMFTDYFQYLHPNSSECIIVSPDIGGIKRCKDISNLCGTDIAIIYKGKCLRLCILINWIHRKRFIQCDFLHRFVR